MCQKISEYNNYELAEQRDEILENIQSGGVIGTGCGWALIHHYSKWGFAMAVWLLLEKGCDVNAKSKSSATPLIAAMYRGLADVVQLLLARGAEVNAKGEYGLTALMEASRSGRAEIVKLLLDAGADIEVRDTRGKTAWDYAKATKYGKHALPVLKEARRKTGTSSWLFG
jgi:ankyrin repeat protein